jgi:hypothetical protein
MTFRIGAAGMSLLLVVACAHGETVKIDDYHWDGVQRIVAIGDLHGDYEQYMKVLQSAGLVNSRGKWTGGKTHLVQTGDVPDRGPRTLDIIKHLAQLKKQAAKKGGQVHTLIGNHEAMNSYGDLRYVTAEEFQAFTNKNSAQTREKQWEFQLGYLKQKKPEVFLTMDLEQYRIQWEKEIPLGWVEHRLNWSPSGEYGQWVLGNNIAVMVNDTIFLHGGLSPEFCQYSLQEITEMGRVQLQNYDRSVDGVLNDENGPLWYRGLAREDEAYFKPAVDQILNKYGASRIVVGHSPTGGIVWPRFDGKVVVNDTGIANYYGSNIGWLEIIDGTAYAGYKEGKLDMPTDEEGRLAYLQQVIEFKPENKALQERLSEMTTPETEQAVTETSTEDAQAIEDAPVREPISPGICLSGSS